MYDSGNVGGGGSRSDFPQLNEPVQNLNFDRFFKTSQLFKRNFFPFFFLLNDVCFFAVRALGQAAFRYSGKRGYE